MLRAVLIVVIATMSMGAPAPAKCRCDQSEFETEFYKEMQRGMPFAQAHVMEQTVSGSLHDKLEYTLFVKVMYSDCVGKLPRAQMAYTMMNSTNDCGVPLKVHEDYVLPLHRDPSKATKISACKHVVAVKKLTKRQQSFLWTRSFKSCAGRVECGWGQMPFHCTPRKQYKKPCTHAKRVYVNACNACAAEWFTWTGLPVCLTNIT